MIAFIGTHQEYKEKQKYYDNLIRVNEEEHTYGMVFSDYVLGHSYPAIQDYRKLVEAIRSRIRL